MSHYDTDYIKLRSNSEYHINEDKLGNPKPYFMSQTNLYKVEEDDDINEAVDDNSFIDTNKRKLAAPFKVSIDLYDQKSIIYSANYNFIQMYTSLSNNKAPKLFYNNLKIFVSSYTTEYTLSNPFGYTVYLITGTNIENKDFKVHRRYTEFTFLHEILQESYPGLFIPPIPPKQFLGNQEEGFIKLRKKFIQQFFHRICETPHLANDKFTAMFLDEKITNFSDIPFEIYLAKPKDKLNFYQSYFKFLEEKEMNQKVVHYVNDFSKLLLKVKPYLMNYVDVATESQNSE